MYIQADNNGVKKTTGQSWRLVHNGQSVLTLNESTGTTVTSVSNELFVVATKAECDAEIGRLGLIKPDYIQ